VTACGFEGAREVAALQPVLDCIGGRHP
jgi:hypothetical protein